MKKLIAIALLFAATTHTYEIIGSVIGITDGDPIKILDETKILLNEEVAACV